MGQQVAGQARVKVSGGLLETDGETTLELGGVKRDSVKGDYQASAFREETEPSKVEISILMKAGVSLKAIQAIAGETLTVEFDTGTTYVIPDAYCAEPPSVTQKDGKAKLVFMGAPAEELA